VWPFGRGGSVGQRGEILAAEHLRRAGLKILARNYRCPAGEADIIAMDGSTVAELGAQTIAFVEVKTRTGSPAAAPEAAVDRRKQSKLVAVARHYLAGHDAEGYLARFDVVAVLLPPDGPATVRHIVGAFGPG